MAVQVRSGEIHSPVIWLVSSRRPWRHGWNHHQGSRPQLSVAWASGPRRIPRPRREALQEGEVVPRRRFPALERPSSSDTPVTKTDVYLVRSITQAEVHTVLPSGLYPSWPMGPARDTRELVEDLFPEGWDLSLKGPSLPPLVGRLAVWPTSEAIEHLPNVTHQPYDHRIGPTEGMIVLGVQAA